MTTVYSEKLPELGVFRLAPLDPGQHLDLVARWVREPRARFWGMTALHPEQIREIYSFLASLESHHAYLMRLDDQPVGIFQTYQPAADPVGEHYPVEPGDLGIHLFLAAPATAPIPGFTGAIAGALTRYLFADPAVTRLVVEPDVRNEPALRRWRRLGFRFGPVIDLPEKRAQLAFLRRAEATTSKSGQPPAGAGVAVDRRRGGVPRPHALRPGHETDSGRPWPA